MSPSPATPHSSADSPVGDDDGTGTGRCATLGDVNARIVRTLAAVAMATVLVASCGDDGDPTSVESRSTTTVATSDPTGDTTTPTSVAPTTEAPTTVAESTTTAAPTTTKPPAGWTAVESMPSLAYVPCCATNYAGDPSPAIPADAGAALAPGIYHAYRAQPAEGEPADTATITFDLAPFVACGTTGISCNEPFVAGEMGVGDVAREVTMPLTDDVRVVVGGFACASDGNFTTDHRAGDGALLATLQARFDEQYQYALGSSLENLADPQAVIDAVAAQGTVEGFSVPECEYAGALVYQPEAGPAILLQSLLTYDPVLDEVVVPRSASIAFLDLTALEVDAAGTPTLYFYAGFLS